MKTKKAVATHNAIVEAAKELFLEKPVSKVSVSAICEKAHVAKGTFYLYFETKEDLVWHFIEHELSAGNQWIARVGGRGHEEEDLEAIAEYIVTFTKKHLKVLKMMHNVRFYGYLGHSIMEKKYKDQWVIPIADYLEQGRLLGKFDIEDSEFMAYYLVTSIHEMIDRIILEEVPYSLDDFLIHLKPLLKKLIMFKA